MCQSRRLCHHRNWNACTGSWSQTFHIETGQRHGPARHRVAASDLFGICVFVFFRVRVIAQCVGHKGAGFYAGPFVDRTFDAHLKWGNFIARKHTGSLFHITKATGVVGHHAHQLGRHTVGGQHIVAAAVLDAHEFIFCGHFADGYQLDAVTATPYNRVALMLVAQHHTANPPDIPDAAPVANDGWFPAINLEQLKREWRFDSTVSDERLRREVLDAMVEINERLPETTPQQESPYELQRLLQNLLKWGTVAAVRAKPLAVRMQCGDNTTDWLTPAGLAAGAVFSAYRMPEVGEQGLALCAGGDLGQGVALLGIYSDAMPQPSDGRYDRTHAGR